MGVWSHQAWGNDGAADWYADFFSTTKSREYIVESLQSDNSEELRAASFLVLQLCRVYMWPIDHLGADLRLAHQALKKVLEDEEYIYGDEIREAVEVEIKELAERIND